MKSGIPVSIPIPPGAKGDQELPSPSAMRDYPAMHSQNVGNAHEIPTKPPLVGVFELDVSVKLIPSLAFTNERQNLVVQIDHIIAERALVLFRGGRVMPYIDNIDVLIPTPN